jgi:hypothetical protein
MQIFIQQNGQQAGPFSVEEIRGMLAARSVAPTGLGWHDGLTDWQPLNTLLPIPAQTPAPVPPPILSPVAANPASSRVVTAAPVAMKSQVPPTPSAKPSVVKPEHGFYRRHWKACVIVVVALILILQEKVVRSNYEYRIKQEDERAYRERLNYARLYDRDEYNRLMQAEEIARALKR